jgi:hypothetical protein
MQTAGRKCGLKYKQGKEVFPGLKNHAGHVFIA